MNRFDECRLTSLHDVAGLPDNLSSAGARRRDAMLAGLQARVRTRGRLRLMTRAGAVTLPVLALAGAAVLALRAPPPPAPPGPLALPGGAPRAEAPAPGPRTPEAPPTLARSLAAPLRLVGYVTDRADVIDRFRASPAPLRVEVLDESGLLGALREAGLPAGTVRTAEGLRVAFDASGAPDATP